MFTTVCEISTAIAFWMFWIKRFSPDLKFTRLIFAGFITSFATLPYVWFVFPVLITQKIWYILVSELFAVIVEAAIYFFILNVRWRVCFVLSFVCNMASFGIGSILFGRI